MTQPLARLRDWAVDFRTRRPERPDLKTEQQALNLVIWALLCGAIPVLPTAYIAVNYWQSETVKAELVEVVYLPACGGSCYKPVVEYEVQGVRYEVTLQQPSERHATHADRLRARDYTVRYAADDPQDAVDPGWVHDWYAITAASLPVAGGALYLLPGPRARVRRAKELTG